MSALPNDDQLRISVDDHGRVHVWENPEPLPNGCDDPRIAAYVRNVATAINLCGGVGRCQRLAALLLDTTDEQLFAAARRHGQEIGE